MTGQTFNSIKITGITISCACFLLAAPYHVLAADGDAEDIRKTQEAYDTYVVDPEKRLK